MQRWTAPPLHHFEGSVIAAALYLLVSISCSCEHTEEQPSCEVTAVWSSALPDSISSARMKLNSSSTSTIFKMSSDDEKPPSVQSGEKNVYTCQTAYKQFIIPGVNCCFSLHHVDRVYCAVMRMNCTSALYVVCWFTLLCEWSVCCGFVG